jgi:hypothetical protein
MLSSYLWAEVEVAGAGVVAGPGHEAPEVVIVLLVILELPGPEHHFLQIIAGKGTFQEVKKKLIRSRRDEGGDVLNRLGPGNAIRIIFREIERFFPGNTIQNPGQAFR